MKKKLLIVLAIITILITVFCVGFYLHKKNIEQKEKERLKMLWKIQGAARFERLFLIFMKKILQKGKRQGKYPLKFPKRKAEIKQKGEFFV